MHKIGVSAPIFVIHKVWHYFYNIELNKLKPYTHEKATNCSFGPLTVFI